MRAALPLLIAALLTAPACAWLGSGDEQRATRARRGELVLARQDLARREYAAAIEHADRALRFRSPGSEVEAEAALIKADAFEGLAHHAEAAQLCRYVIAIHADSEQAARARERLEELAARDIDVGPLATGTQFDEPLTRLQMSRLVVERPWLEEPVEIFYPFQAEALGLEGYVEVRLFSDALGRLSSYEVVEATHPVFQDAVVRALPRLKFDVDEMASSDPPNVQKVRFTFRLRES